MSLFKIDRCPACGSTDLVQNETRVPDPMGGGRFVTLFYACRSCDHDWIGETAEIPCPFACPLEAMTGNTLLCTECCSTWKTADASAAFEVYEQLRDGEK